MKTKTTYAPLLLLVVLAGGCNGSDTFTGPPLTPSTNPSATPTPTVGNSTLQLAGEWSGTLAIRVRRNPEEFPCSAPVSGVLTQSGATVTARLASQCGGNVRFDATLAGATITGILATDSIFGAPFVGSASAARILLQTSPGEEGTGIVNLDLSR